MHYRHTDASAVSTFVSVPSGTITTLNNLRTTYKNTVGAGRAAAYRSLLTALQNLMSLFQTAANNDPANAAAIIESGGFGIKEVHISQEWEFTVENGDLEGSVDLTGTAGPKNKKHLHIWFSSLDEVTFKMEYPTNAAKQHIEGFEVGKYAYFIHQLSIEDVLQPVSQIIRIMIK